MSKHWGASMVFAACAVACSSGEEPIDIGEDRTGEKLSDYGATWDGYAEAYTFSDGSDRVRVNLAEDGTGRVIVGDTPISEPPTDPNVWPYTGDLYELQPGIEYPIVDAIVEQRRLRLQVDLLALARPWCELHTPILDEANSGGGQEVYSCVPNLRTMGGKGGSCFVGTPEGSAEEWEEVDCGKLGMCGAGGACYCDANGCTAGDYATPALDAAWAEDGNALFGTLTGHGDVTVRLYREP